jgi:predicted RNA-binding protein with PUA-like domain
MNYWLMKSEPTEFSIDDLQQRRIEPWDGVRNYQARNLLRDQMKRGDLGFFYHSNCAPPGIAGIFAIAREGYPDLTAFDPQNHHYDAASDPAKPRWYQVDVSFVQKFPRLIPLDQLRLYPQLQNLALLRRGNRLSVMPVSAEEWEFILRLAG